MFTCGRCGTPVSKNTRNCPSCRAILAGIECQSCGFKGTEDDFPGDRCPECGSIVRGSGTTRRDESGIWGLVAVLVGLLALIGFWHLIKLGAKVGPIGVVAFLGVLALIAYFLPKRS